MSPSVKYLTIELDKKFNRRDMYISYIKPDIKFSPCVIAETKVLLSCSPTDGGFKICCAAPLDLCVGKILRYVSIQGESLLSYCNITEEQ